MPQGNPIEVTGHANHLTSDVDDVKWHTQANAGGLHEGLFPRPYPEERPLLRFGVEHSENRFLRWRQYSARHGTEVDACRVLLDIHTDLPPHG